MNRDRMTYLSEQVKYKYVNKYSSHKPKSLNMENAWNSVKYLCTYILDIYRPTYLAILNVRQANVSQ